MNDDTSKAGASMESEREAERARLLWPVGGVAVLALQVGVDPLELQGAEEALDHRVIPRPRVSKRKEWRRIGIAEKLLHRGSSVGSVQNSVRVPPTVSGSDYGRQRRFEELACAHDVPKSVIDPAAWRHVHLNGHYTFRGNGQVIDLDAIVAGLDLG
jgi:hypothetical protein